MVKKPPQKNFHRRSKTTQKEKTPQQVYDNHKKILFFLSPLPKNAVSKEYTCPNGSTVMGAQTNEAPVSYLLNAHKDIRQVVALVTPEAESAWQPFQAEMKKNHPYRRLVFEKVSFPSGGGMSDFPLQTLLKQLEPGDSMYWDATGGLRSTVFQLLLITQSLETKGIQTVQMVYSNWAKSLVEDITPTLRLFDLIHGVREMILLGNVETLRTYQQQLPESSDKNTLDTLLQAMDGVSDALTLCRPGQVKAQTKRLDKALNKCANASNPVIATLAPVFREKYGASFDTVSLIEWCLQSHLLQQAITVYIAHLPGYLVEKGVFQCDALLEQGERMYESVESGVFYNLSKTTIRYGVRNLPSSTQVNCDVAAFCELCSDYFYLRAVRNMMCHGNHKNMTDDDTIDTLYRIPDGGYIPLENLKTVQVESALRRALHRVRKVVAPVEQSL